MFYLSYPHLLITMKHIKIISYLFCFYDKDKRMPLVFTKSYAW
jgi:hypothetical protein